MEQLKRSITTFRSFSGPFCQNGKWNLSNSHFYFLWFSLFWITCLFRLEEIVPLSRSWQAWTRSARCQRKNSRSTWKARGNFWIKSTGKMKLRWDYVLVAVAEPQNLSKPQPRWSGFYQITEVVSDWSFVVKYLVSKAEKTVHASRLQVYSDKDLNVTIRLQEQIGTTSGRERIPSLYSMASNRQTSVATNGYHVPRCSQASTSLPRLSRPALPTALRRRYQSLCVWLQHVRNKHFSSIPSGFGVLVGMPLKDGVPNFCSATDVFWSFDFFQKGFLWSFVSFSFSEQRDRRGEADSQGSFPDWRQRTFSHTWDTFLFCSHSVSSFRTTTNSSGWLLNSSFFWI